MYGLVMGRPAVIRSDVSDVVVPAPINADGTRNFFNVYQRHLIKLFHLAGETVEKVKALGRSIMYANRLVCSALVSELRHLRLSMKWTANTSNGRPSFLLNSVLT
jgi:hypothetical protein